MGLKIKITVNNKSFCNQKSSTIKVSFRLSYCVDWHIYYTGGRVFQYSFHTILPPECSHRSSRRLEDFCWNLSPRCHSRSIFNSQKRRQSLGVSSSIFFHNFEGKYSITQHTVHIWHPVTFRHLPELKTALKGQWTTLPSQQKSPRRQRNRDISQHSLFYLQRSEVDRKYPLIANYYYHYSHLLLSSWFIWLSYFTWFRDYYFFSFL